jgi:ribosomal-protein-alanine N-acetyltransferase
VVDELRTERLWLRAWRPEDREPFAALNADPIVMEHYPSTLTREESDALVDRIEARFDLHGWGLWAVEIVETGEFAGYVGLTPQTFDVHFTPAVEVGWRLAHEFWGRGYAPEGGQAALEYAFDVIGLEEVVSFTSVTNVRSQRVMQKIGMTRDPADDFDHPALPEGDPLRPHVLYRITRVSLDSSP